MCSKVTLAKSREQPRSTRSRWSKPSANQGSRLALSGSSRVRYDAAIISNCPSLMNLNFVRLASKRQTLLVELQEPSLTGCSSGWSRSATQPWWERRRSDFQCQHIRLGSFHFFRHHLATFSQLWHSNSICCQRQSVVGNLDAKDSGIHSGYLIY